MVRAAFRLSRVGVHLCYAVATIALVYPWVTQARRHALKQRWSSNLLTILGICLHHAGGRIGAPALIVANHVSWLDIYAVNAVAPATFVSKDDVRQWPLIGWLVVNTGSIFIERGKRRATQRAVERIRASLEAGEVVVIFPEGTTSDGTEVLPFHGGLLQAAIDSGCALQPLALDYTDSAGARTTAPAYAGTTTMWQSLWAVVMASGLRVNLLQLAPLAPTSGDRRSLAALAHARIGRCLERRKGSGFRPQWTAPNARATLDACSRSIEERGDELAPARDPV